MPRPLLAAAFLLIASFSPAQDAVSAAADQAKAGDPAPLEKLLRDSEPSVRARACDELGRLRLPSSTAKVAAVLSKDADPRVRQAAATSLAFIGDASAAGALIGALKDAAPPVRHAAMRALGKLRVAGAAGPLAEALADPDPSARKVAAASLGEIGAPEALPSLKNALSDADAGVRVQAAAALAKAGDAAGLPAAYAALRASDASTRQLAATAIGQVGDAKGLAALDLAKSAEKDANTKGVIEFARAQLASRVGAVEKPKPSKKPVPKGKK